MLDGRKFQRRDQEPQFSFIFPFFICLVLECLGQKWNIKKLFSDFFTHRPPVKTTIVCLFVFNDQLTPGTKWTWNQVDQV